MGKPLAERGYRIVAPSRFGALRTPIPSELTVEAQADAHVCLLDALNIDKVNVYGMSAGSPSSIKFVHKYNNRSKALALSVPASSSMIDPKTPKPYYHMSLGVIPLAFLGVFNFDVMYWLVAKLAPSVLVSAVFATPSHLFREANEVDKAQVDDILEQLMPISAHNKGLYADEQLLKEDIMDDIMGIQVPTMTVSYRDCGFGSYGMAETIADHVPGGKFLGYAHGGYLGVGYFDEVHHKIGEFFRQAGRQEDRRVDA